MGNVMMSHRFTAPLYRFMVDQAPTRIASVLPATALASLLSTTSHQVAKASVGTSKPASRERAKTGQLTLRTTSFTSLLRSSPRWLGGGHVKSSHLFRIFWVFTEDGRTGFGPTG